MRQAVNIAILTTARSDFGLLKPVIRHAARRFHVDLLVTGSHFLRSRGHTLREIEEAIADEPVDIVQLPAMVDEDTADAQCRTLAQTQLLASGWFQGHRCDLLLFLGDRWDLWGVTLPAFLHGIPLAHISGGEVTEGVIDDSVRHAHTKLSALHFVAAEEYARNVSRMGEEDWRICAVGECGLDLIHEQELATPQEVMDRFSVDLRRRPLLVTFHPSTLDQQTPVQDQIGTLLQALSRFADRQIVFTAPGVEQGSDIVLAAIRSFVAAQPNAVLVDHFGSRNYLAVMKAALVVVGNSSSGVVEAASLGVPAVDVGQRQKNRLAAASVQHVGYDADAIEAAIARAASDPFQSFARTCPNPYDPFRDGKNSLRIVQALERALTTLSPQRLRVKKFDTQVHPAAWNTLLKENPS
jgi:GDP/UDP-N,N'-diacetylbacillosamine 2-epimerase (hydrolysing)